MKLLNHRECRGHGEDLIVSMSSAVDRRRGSSQIDAVSIASNELRHCSATVVSFCGKSVHLILLIHSPGFPFTFFDARNNRFHSFTQPLDCSLLFLYFACLFFDFLMLFEKFVEQHRIHRVISDSEKLTALVPHDQIRIYLCYFFGDQAELRRVCVTRLVLKCDWLELQDCFARFAYWLNFFLQPARGENRTQLAIRIDQDGGSRAYGCAVNARDKCPLLEAFADSNGVRLNARSSRANASDIDVVVPIR